MSIYLTIKTSKLIVLVPVSSGNKFSQRVNNLVSIENFVSGFGLISTRMSFTEMGLNSFHILGPFRARIALVGQDVLERRDFLNGVFHLPGRHVEDGSVEIFCPVVQDFCSLRTFLRTAFFAFVDVGETSSSSSDKWRFLTSACSMLVTCLSATITSRSWNEPIFMRTIVWTCSTLVEDISIEFWWYHGLS